MKENLDKGMARKWPIRKGDNGNYVGSVVGNFQESLLENSGTINLIIYCFLCLPVEMLYFTFVVWAPP